MHNVYTCFLCVNNIIKKACVINKYTRYIIAYIYKFTCKVINWIKMYVFS